MSQGPHGLQMGPYAIDLGPQLAPGGTKWGLSLDWEPLSLERAQLAAGRLVCMSGKFAVATQHRRVKRPRGGSVET